jgi:acetyl esterase
MPLHPQAQAVVTGVQSTGMPPFETLSVEEGRAVIAGFGALMVPAEDVASVVNVAVPGPEVSIPMRVYAPAGDGLLPAILYFHGGGFCTGSIDLVDPLCRALANRSGCVVISVGYRLAPEHPYPAAVLDAYIAANWVAQNGREIGVDSNRLAIAGDSAGANLATVTCMVLRDKGDDVRIWQQVLIYPVTDLVKDDTPSYRDNGEGYLLTRGMMKWFKGHYLSGAEDRIWEPYCSPVRQKDLSGLPPAIIVTAEYDPLRDEGEAYGQLLEMDGVRGDVRRQEGMIHGFFWMGSAIDRGRELIDELGAEIGEELRR